MGAWSAALRAKIEGGSLFAHRAGGTTYAAHSLELKVEGGSLFAHRAGGTTYAAHSLELKVKALNLSKKTFVRLIYHLKIIALATPPLR